MDPVSLPKDRISVWNKDFLPTSHCTDKDTDLKPAINLGKGQVFQSAVRPDTKLHKLHSPLYKCLHFACVREQEHPGDLVGHGQLRVDCHAQMKIVL